MTPDAHPPDMLQTHPPSRRSRHILQTSKHLSRHTDRTHGLAHRSLRYNNLDAAAEDALAAAKRGRAAPLDLKL